MESHAHWIKTSSADMKKSDQPTNIRLCSRALQYKGYHWIWKQWKMGCKGSTDFRQPRIGVFLGWL